MFSFLSHFSALQDQADPVSAEVVFVFDPVNINADVEVHLLNVINQE